MEISKAKHYTMIVAITLLSVALAVTALIAYVFWYDLDFCEEHAERQEMILQIGEDQFDQAAAHLKQLESALSHQEE